MQTRSDDLTQEDVVIDLRTEAAADDDDDGELWVTLDEAVEAAELSGTTGAAIHEWHRAGLIPTRRADGDGGAFLVPLSAIRRFETEGAEPVFDVNATYWSIEAIAAREETAAACEELDEAQGQVAFLREQLAELAAAERAAIARYEVAEAELASLRSIVAATSSITDPSWLDLATNRYEGPVRRQGKAAPSDDEFEVVIDLAAEMPPVVDGDAGAVVEHPAPGLHEDDLLPSPAKGRRGLR